MNDDDDDDDNSTKRYYRRQGRVNYRYKHIHSNRDAEQVR